MALAVGLAITGCGDDGGDDDSDATETTAQSTSTTSAAVTNEEFAACLEDEGLEIAEPGADDLPLLGGTPEDPQSPLLSGVEAVGVRSAAGNANVFVYESSDEAESAATSLEQMALPTVVVDRAVVVMSAPSLPEVESAVTACLG